MSASDCASRSRWDSKESVQPLYRRRFAAHSALVAPFANFVAKAVERSLDIYLDSLGHNPAEYLDLADAAKISKNNYSLEYLSLLARTGKIGAVKFGRNWKITKEALEEYENEHKEK